MVEALAAQRAAYLHGVAGGGALRAHALGDGIADHQHARGALGHGGQVEIALGQHDIAQRENQQMGQKHDHALAALAQIEGGF